VADEIVSVGIKIETTGADKAAASLDKVVSAGGKVDAAADKITAGAGKASKSLETLGATAATVAPQLDKAGSSGGKLGDLFKQATDGAGAFSGSLGLVKAGLVGAVTALSVQSVVELGKSFLRTADAITNLNSQLKLATGSAAAAKDAYEGLFSVAQRSRVGFVELGNTYAQIARATDGLGLSASSSLRIVETLGKAITISGVSAGSASAAMIQLSQGLSSGTLRGEELNSILEQTPRVARAIADGLGVSIGQLRTMGSEGKLTAEAVSGALLKASATIDKEFGSVATTVSQAMTVMGNATTKAVGDFDSIVGVSSAVATGILSIVDAAGQLKEMFSGSWTGQAVAALAAMRQKITDNRDNPTLDMLRVQLDNASRQATGDAGSGFGGEQRKASAQREVARLQERIRKLETDEWDKAAEQISKSADKMVMDYLRVKEAGDKFIEDKDNQTKAQQKESAFAKLRTEFAAATRDLREGSAEYLRVYTAFLTGKDNIAKKFDDKEKVDRSGASKAKSDAEAYAAALAAGGKQLALIQAEAEARRPLTALEKLSIDLKEKEEELSRKHGTSRLAEVQALNEEAKSLVAAIELRKGFAEAKASELAAAVAVDAARKSTVDSLLGEAEAVEAQVKALKQETEAIGLTGVALALLTNARVDDQIQALKNKATVADSGDEVEAIKRQIRALEALKDARIGNAQANASADFAKESAEAAKKSAEEWQKAYDQISQGLTDSLFRAAEAGKGFFATLRDSIKGMFNNLVLKPIIQYGVSGALGALGSLAGAGANAAGIGGGSGLGSISSLASLVSSGYSMANGGGIAGAIGSYLTGSASTASGVSGAAALAIGAETGAVSGVGATAASGLYTALSAIPVWGWVAMAGVAVAAIFGGDRGGPKGGGSFSTTGERLFTPDTADAMATKIGDGLNTSITAS
jgi:tape measure domain-containing protein